MILQIQNLSAFRTDRWHRITCRNQDLPTFRAGTFADGAKFAVGRPLGIEVSALDVWCGLDAGQRRALDLGAAQPMDLPTLSLPPEASADPVGYFGVPTALGTELEFRSVAQDGACLLVRFSARVRTDSLLVLDLDVHYYPDHNVWPAELRVTASNPDVVGPMSTLLQQDLVLQMGACWVWVDDAATTEHVCMRAGDQIGRGQSRAFPLTIIRGNESPAAIVGLGLSAIGPFASLGCADTRYQQGRFDVARWIQDQTPRVGALVSTWGAPTTIGVPADSTQTGDEEDQGAGYQGVEPFFQGGLAAVRTNYLAAIQWAKRPCHHREPDGRSLDLAAHPHLVLWQGPPHYRTTVSPDRYGYSRAVSKSGDMHGWFGPDDEHFLMNRPAAAYEQTGSPAMQHELDMWARLWLASDTLDPHLSTSGPRAGRARGYAGIAVAHWWRLLEDRQLAEQVRQRWIGRCDIYARAEAASGSDLWDTRPSYTVDAAGVKHPTSSSLGSIDLDACPRYSMIYQIALGVYGVWLGSRIVGHAPGVEMAARQAVNVMRAAYAPSESATRVWDEFECCGVSAEGRFATVASGRNSTGMFRSKWLPLCLVPVLYDSQEQQARLQAADIRRVLLAELATATEPGKTYANQPADWFPPWSGSL